GDAVAAVAEDRIAAPQAGNLADGRQAAAALAEGTAPTQLGARIELRQQAGELGADPLRLRRSQRIPPLVVAELLVLAAGDDAPVGRGARVEIGIGCLPDQ